MERVIVQTADIRRLRGDNVPLAWRQSARTTEAIDADEETAEATAASARKDEPEQEDSLPRAPDGDALTN